MHIGLKLLQLSRFGPFGMSAPMYVHISETVSQYKIILQTSSLAGAFNENVLNWIAIE